MAEEPTGNIALLSIHPEYADLILAGRKTVELRRTRFRRHVNYVVIYATDPIKGIVGHFEVSHVTQGTPDEIWIQFDDRMGINRSDYYEYFEDAHIAVAIGVKEVFALESPLELSSLPGNLRPPQNYHYLPLEALSVLQEKQRKSSS